MYSILFYCTISLLKLCTIFFCVRILIYLFCLLSIMIMIMCHLVHNYIFVQHVVRVVFKFYTMQSVKYTTYICAKMCVLPNLLTVFVLYNKVKVKVTLVQALRLCTGRTTHRGSRGIALLFHDHGTRRGVRGQRHSPAALYPWERPGTHCTGGWMKPRAGLDRCRKSRPPPGFDPRTVQPLTSHYTD